MNGNEIDLFTKPQDVLKRIRDEFGSGCTEMSGWQLSFLCGLLRRNNPRKIVEIGVSAGGTTAVIMETLSLIDSDAKLFSVDYSVEYYRDKTKRTGFVAEWLHKELRKENNIRWDYALLTGGGVCNYLDQIGDGIDFLILDTMHICPGEILDFLLCLPFLCKDAVVVLHDIAMHFSGVEYAFATQLLLDTVTAKKIVGRDDKHFHGYPNIGAFQITGETINHIEDVFSALNIPWGYIPQEIDKYKNWFCKYYDEYLIEIFEMAFLNNKDMLLRRETDSINELVRIAKLVNDISGRAVYLYGNGKVGKRLHLLLERAGIAILGHIVSDGESRENGELYFDDVDLNNDNTIVISVGQELCSTIKKNLEKQGYYDYIALTDVVWEA